MSWRLAESLRDLLRELEEAYPKRRKSSDGTIGDEAHRKRRSDHNPNAAGVVCAVDITHDPPRLDAHELAEELVRPPRHPALDYVISKGRIASRSRGFVWRPYKGKNPHDHHIHVSVGVPAGASGRKTDGYDLKGKWLKEEPAVAEVVSPRLFVNDMKISSDSWRIESGTFWATIESIYAALKETAEKHGLKVRLVYDALTKTTKLWVRAAK